MDVLFFLLGVGAGAGLYHLWTTTRTQDNDYELRLQALEEQISYLAIRLEDTQENKAARPTRPKKASAAAVGTRQEQILELIAQGLEPQAIARELGIPLGQVELVTRLFRREES